jgi:hypothetical protein
MTAKTPLALVKGKFGDKAKLVEAVEKLASEELWVARTNKDKGLAHVSNAKLLRLHAIFTEVKETFGTRDKLVEAILQLEKRTQDVGLKQRLSSWPVPRLFDAYRSAKKRSAGPASGHAATDVSAKDAPEATPAATKPTDPKLSHRTAKDPIR